ncbi:helix-turn-helix transcriptional regulator [Chryseobacterium sp. MHB01]|uniref:helix-turn-helix domain-containing protein n=1 Tax=Chryseobacterium sp. MHB01 TaxID=3109433 RepID=UPI002AFEDDE3|nr:helix-turn-helix transcriptional regulator [Chryseobacterium sp. MHB01]MEA1849228.1 helix-turn-helix transcriptional regulator [Chryseobacterium sp. MHB01]
MWNLDEVLKKHGSSRTELAEKLGKKKNTISGYDKNPSLQTLEAIAAALEIDIRDLFPEKQPDNSQEIFTKDEKGNFTSIGFIRK